MSTKNSLQHHQVGAKAVAIERHALAELEKRLDERFDLACDILLATKGRVIVLGVGKSGHIGRKIASTLASTGTPAFYVHPTEASHGDLGMLTPDDSIIAISNSGGTAELVVLLPLLKQIGVKIIAITGNLQSKLASYAHTVLDISISEEACPLGLAPTASTTATLALGDAIAVALLTARQFSSADFATRHPGGHLGKKLLSTARDVMHSGDAVPIVAPTTNIAEAVFEISQKRLGITAVLDDGKFVGIFTDGDLRRCIDSKNNLFEQQIGDAMTRNPLSCAPETLTGDILASMQDKKITHMPVIDDEQLLGIVHIHDLLHAGGNA